MDPLNNHNGARQPPTPPSNVVEPPESADDQAKIKHWRDRALQAEARLAERDRQVQKQNMDILDLSWKARIAEDWTAIMESCHGRPGCIWLNSLS